MWHTFQKNMSWYKPSKVTEDPEFNQLFAELRCLIPRTRDLLANFNKTEKAWFALRDNYKQLLGLMNPKHDAGTLAWELCERGQIEIQKWEQLRPLRQAPLSNEASEFAEAKKALTEYHAALLGAYAVGEKRTKVLRDLNYFNGKLEYVEARKEVDPSEYHITLYEQENRQRTYTRINKAAVEDMREALALADIMINQCLSAYLDLQKELAAGLNPFLKTPEKMPETKNAKWPHITPLALKVKQNLLYLANPNDKNTPPPQVSRDAEAIKYADPNFALRLAQRTPSNSSMARGGPTGQVGNPLLVTASESVLFKDAKDKNEVGDGDRKEGGVRSMSMPAVVVVGLVNENKEVEGGDAIQGEEDGSDETSDGKTKQVEHVEAANNDTGVDTKKVTEKENDLREGDGKEDIGTIDGVDTNKETRRSTERMGNDDDRKEEGVKMVKEKTRDEGTGVADSGEGQEGVKVVVGGR